jgi:hypothetical protein
MISEDKYASQEYDGSRQAYHEVEEGEQGRDWQS